MEHFDAKAIRERLNLLALTLANLEAGATAAQLAIIAQAQAAIREIAALVTGDEDDEHGEPASPAVERARRVVRANSHVRQP